MNLGSVAFDAGDHLTAVVLWNDVLEHHRAHDNLEGQAIAHLNLGMAAYRLGHADDAEPHFSAAAELFEAIGFREHLAHALQGLAATEAARDRNREAASLLGRAADTARRDRIGNRNVGRRARSGGRSGGPGSTRRPRLRLRLLESLVPQAVGPERRGPGRDPG